eukprot:Hpha_TRINITY_DN16015_c5_g2::TRINITY_DN16015_c5_g2_i5::g.117104::m.117104
MGGEGYARHDTSSPRSGQHTRAGVRRHGSRDGNDGGGGHQTVTARAGLVHGARVAQGPVLCLGPEPVVVRNTRGVRRGVRGRGRVVVPVTGLRQVRLRCLCAPQLQRRRVGGASVVGGSLCFHVARTRHVALRRLQVARRALCGALSTSEPCAGCGVVLLCRGQGTVHMMRGVALPGSLRRVLGSRPLSDLVLRRGVSRRRVTVRLTTGRLVHRGRRVGMGRSRRTLRRVSRCGIRRRSRRRAARALGVCVRVVEVCCRLTLSGRSGRGRSARALQISHRSGTRVVGVCEGGVGVAFVGLGSGARGRRVLSCPRRGTLGGLGVGEGVAQCIGVAGLGRRVGLPRRPGRLCLRRVRGSGGSDPVLLLRASRRLRRRCACVAECGLSVRQVSPSRREARCARLSLLCRRCRVALGAAERHRMLTLCC